MEKLVPLVKGRLHDQDMMAYDTGFVEEAFSFSQVTETEQWKIVEEEKVYRPPDYACELIGAFTALPHVISLLPISEPLISVYQRQCQ
jgi:hypothetical protein